MAISAKDVMALRQRTGLGMMECKGALQETDGDAEAAIELLRKKLKGKMDERADRAAAEGAVAVAEGDDSIAIVELNTETDFTARNEGFIAATQQCAELALQCDDGAVESATDPIKEVVDNQRITTKENISFRRGFKMSGQTLGSYVHHNRKVGVIIKVEGEADDELLTGLCQHIAAAVPTPIAVDEAGLPADEVEKHRNEAIEEAEATGKPREIAEKIAIGKLRKWVDENTLLGQQYVKEMESKKQVKDVLPKGTKVLDFVRFAVGV